MPSTGRDRWLPKMAAPPIDPIGDSLAVSRYTIVALAAKGCVGEE